MNIDTLALLLNHDVHELKVYVLQEDAAFLHSTVRIKGTVPLEQTHQLLQTAARRRCDEELSPTLVTITNRWTVTHLLCDEPVLGERLH